MPINLRKTDVRFKVAENPTPKHFFCFGTVNFETSGKKLRINQKVLFDFLEVMIQHLQTTAPHNWKIFKDILQYRNSNPLWDDPKMVVHYVKEEGALHFFLKTGDPDE